MAGLLFKPQDLRNELQSLNAMAAPLLDQNTRFVLDKLDSDIVSLVANGGSADLEIPVNSPLRTRVSIGEYELSTKNCNRRVFGTVSGKWEAALSRSGKGGKTRHIEFTGIASTEVKVFDEDRDTPIAVWKVELGDSESPGCYFHAHFGAFEGDFPVPRQPSLFATPMSAIAHALGELFQDRWEQVVTGTSYHPNQWRSIQKRRLGSLLKWKLDQIETTDSSPWIALKTSKPPAKLFLKEPLPVASRR